MNSKKHFYRPSPQNVDDIRLGNDLTALTELLAENTHDVWAQARLAEGWRYGERRDDALKLHPCLVPYPELTETEKEYDRQTAMNTLRLVGKFGFMILKKSPVACPDCGQDVAMGMNYCPHCGRKLVKG